MNGNVQCHSNDMLTPTQEETLREITRFKNERGFCPTMQELAEILGISRASVHERVNILVRKQYLSKEPGTLRSLVILKDVSNENDAQDDNFNNEE